MRYLFFLSKILFDESKKRFFLLKALFFAFLYFFLSIILLNLKTILSIFSADFSLLNKFNIILTVLYGTLSSVSPKDLILLLIVSLLFGVNLELVLRKIKFIKKQGGLHLTIGAGIISIAAAGCASCGLSLASLAGLSFVVALLPFGGIELYILAILLLTFLLFYNLNQFVKACKIPQR